MKSCSQCGCEKPREDFHRRAASKDGLTASCKVCLKKYREKNKVTIARRKKIWRESNSEHVKTYGRKWYEDNRLYFVERRQSETVRQSQREAEKKFRKAHPDRVNERNRRRYARKRSLPAEKIDYRVIHQRDIHCYLCDVPFRSDDLTHVDHKVPLSRTDLKPTHTYDNCALTHAHCNVKKGSLTPEEFWSTFPNHRSQND